MGLFSLRMAWRETTAAWRHFVYFLLCIAVGVGAVVGIGLFAANVDRAVAREARALLGGDLEIRSSRALSESGQAVLRSVIERGGRLSHASELVAMAATGSPSSPAVVTQIVELKAVDSVYPLYGGVKIEPDHPLHQLLDKSDSGCGPGSLLIPRAPTVCYGAVVQESLTIRMGLRVGQQLKIGQVIFVIRGIIRKEPDRMANMFSLGPRVMVSQAGLAAAELIKPGSRVRERYLVKLPMDRASQPLLHELRGRLSKESVRVSSFRDAQPQLKQFLDQLGRYLGLIGLTALFVGGIGVATSVQAFLQEKLQSIAVLKTLGADSHTIVLLYVIQTLCLGLLGCGLGVAVGLLLQSILPLFIGGLLDASLLEQVEFSSALSWGALLPIMKGFGLGVLSTLLFSLWPLLTIRRIRPARIFRRELVQEERLNKNRSSSLRSRLVGTLREQDRTTVFSIVTIVAGLVGLSTWQAGSWKTGWLFIGGLAAAVFLLLAAASLLVKTISVLPLPRAVAVRHAVMNLGRPGSHATSMMMAIGIGVMVIVTIGLLERSLIRQIGENRPTDAPTFFFIDLQPDQAEPFNRLLESRPGTPKAELTPLIRSRLYAVNGQPVKVDEESEKSDNGDNDRKEEKRKSWYLTREYVLTFLDGLPKDNTIVKGAWWKPGQTFPKPLVSMEEDLAKSLGLDIGSTIELDIQGTTREAEVGSIRKVEWGNFSTNFYMILSPGSLDGAPFTYVATVRVPPEEEVPLQQAVVSAFPNVTALNIGDMLDGFARVLDRLALAIRAVAAFCLITGALVMAAALAATRYRRLYESVVLKAVGATRGLIARSFATEYAVLGAVAGAIGVMLASALSWAALRYLFDLPWSLHPKLLAVSFLFTVLLTVAVGFLSTYRMLGEKPLAILRHE